MCKRRKPRKSKKEEIQSEENEKENIKQHFDWGVKTIKTLLWRLGAVASLQDRGFESCQGKYSIAVVLNEFGMMRGVTCGNHVSLSDRRSTVQLTFRGERGSSPLGENFTPRGQLHHWGITLLLGAIFTTGV